MKIVRSDTVPMLKPVEPTVKSWDLTFSSESVLLALPADPPIPLHGASPSGETDRDSTDFANPGISPLDVCWIP